MYHINNFLFERNRTRRLTAGWETNNKMNPEGIKEAYFIGIGGIGMSALARYFYGCGATVSGYDLTSTPLTDQLIKEGIPVHFKENLDDLPRSAELIVYTPAIPKNHIELEFYRNNHYQIKKRSEVLGELTKSRPTIAVAGTHGKTTVATLITHLLKCAGIDCSAFLGGVSKNFNSNYISGSADWIVVEADEYDYSFLKLNPHIALITYMDPDHLDVYGSINNLKNSYLEFAKKVAPDGILIYRAGLSELSELNYKKGITYSLGLPEADYSARNMRLENINYRFDLNSPDGCHTNFLMRRSGRQNVENAIAALATCLELGAPGNLLREALIEYRGIERRFEYIIDSEQLVFIDDYAHHPTEIRTLLESVRALYPKKNITIIFQPHLFTRTRDFAAGFAESLDLADRIILLPIYPAREEPLPEISSDIIFKKMKNPEKIICSKDEIFDHIKNKDFDVLVTAGAGDISDLVAPIREVLK